MSTATVHPLTPAIQAVDNRRARSRQRKLGASSLGTCRRRVGYQLAGTPKTDSEGTKLAAALGTMIHKGYLAAVQAEYGAIVEVKLEDAEIKSSADAVYLDAPTLALVAAPPKYAKPSDVCTLEDGKTRGFHWFQQIVDTQRPPRKELFQTMTYADLLRKGQVTDRRLRGIPVPIERVRLRYISRDNGAEYVHEQPFSQDLADEARDWLHEVTAAALSPAGPDSLPRDEDGPGLSVICDGCPFRTACWGPQREDGRMVQANLVRDDRDVAAALAEYDALRAAAKEIEEAKKLNRAKLDASPPGQYDGYVLRWSGGQNLAKAKVDVEHMVELFTEAGLEVPYLPQGVTSRSIGVSRAG